MTFEYLTKEVMAKAIELAETRHNRGSDIHICCEVENAYRQFHPHVVGGGPNAYHEIGLALTARGIPLGGNWLRSAYESNGGNRGFEVANLRRLELMREIMEELPDA
jgi:hypothetical protein